MSKEKDLAENSNILVLKLAREHLIYSRLKLLPLKNNFSYSFMFISSEARIIVGKIENLLEQIDDMLSEYERIKHEKV